MTKFLCIELSAKRLFIRGKIIIVATTTDFLHLWAHHTKWDYICVFISLCCIRLWGQPSLEWALYLIVFTIHSTQYIKSKNTFHLMDIYLFSNHSKLWKWITVGPMFLSVTLCNSLVNCFTNKMFTGYCKSITILCILFVRTFIMWIFGIVLVLQDFYKRAFKCLHCNIWFFSCLKYFLFLLLFSI